MLNDTFFDLFGNPLYPSFDDYLNQLKSDFDLVLISKRKLTPSLRRQLNNDFYISDVICHQLFPVLHTLEVQRFNDDANSRFS